MPPRTMYRDVRLDILTDDAYCVTSLTDTRPPPLSILDAALTSDMLIEDKTGVIDWFMLNELLERVPLPTRITVVKESIPPIDHKIIKAEELYEERKTKKS